MYSDSAVIVMVLIIELQDNDRYRALLFGTFIIETFQKTLLA